MKIFQALCISCLLLVGCNGGGASDPVPYQGTWRMAFIEYNADDRVVGHLYAVVEVNRPTNNTSTFVGGQGDFRICRGEGYTQCDAQASGQVNVGVSSSGLGVTAYAGSELLILALDYDGQLDNEGAIDGLGSYFYPDREAEGLFYFRPVNDGLN